MIYLVQKKKQYKRGFGGAYMRRGLPRLLVALWFMIFILTACNAKENEQMSIPENVTALPNDTDAASILTELAIGPIQDEAIINYLWDTYYYHAIYSILNFGTFESVEQLDSYTITAFLTAIYSYKYPMDLLARDASEKNYRLLPYDQMRPLMQEYFNMENLEVTSLPEHFYRIDKNAFLINDLEDQQESFTYIKGNSFGIYLEHLEYLSNGNIECDLNTYYSIEGHEQEVERSYHLVLKPHKNQPNHYYFASGKDTLYPMNLVTIEGKYEEVNTWDDMKDHFNNYLVGFGYVGEDKSNIVMRSQYENELLLFDKNTFTSQKKATLLMDASVMRKKTKQYGDVLMVSNLKEIQFYDYGLNLLHSITLPTELKPFIVENVWNNEGTELLDGFMGYDISYDLSKIVFCDEAGLKTMDLLTGDITFVQEKIPSTSKFSLYSLLSQPRYFGENDHILAYIPGYECNAGYYYYNGTTKASLIDLYTSDFEPIARINGVEHLIAIQNTEEVASGNPIQQPRMINLETGETKKLPIDFANLGFAIEFSHSNDGYTDGQDFIVNIQYNESRSEAILTYLDYDGTRSQDQLILTGPNLVIDILCSYRNTSGEVNVLLNYQSASQENEIIMWKSQ